LDRARASGNSAVAPELENLQNQVVVLSLDLSLLVEVFLEVARPEMGKLGGGRLLLIYHALDIEKGVQVLLIIVMITVNKIRGL
jgi:hypothetical protein